MSSFRRTRGLARSITYLPASGRVRTGSAVTLGPVQRRGETGLLIAMGLGSLSLRPQLVGIGPLLDNIKGGLHVSHAVAGLLRLPESSAQRTRHRSSHKKAAPEGSVIVSRLRPYLRQVAWIPHGLHRLTGGRDVVCSTEFHVLTPNDDESIAFLVPWLLSDAVQTLFANATTGGHHPRFDEALLWSLRVPHAVWRRRRALSRAVEQATLEALHAQRSLDALHLSVRDMQNG